MATRELLMARQKVPLPKSPLPGESDYVRDQRKWGQIAASCINENSASIEGSVNTIGTNLVGVPFNATFANGGGIASSASLPTVALTGGTLFACGGEVAVSDSSFTLESFTDYIYYSIDDEGTVSFTKDAEYTPDAAPKVAEEEMTTNRLLFRVYKDSTGDFYLLENIYSGGDLEMPNRWWNFVYPQESGNGIVVSDKTGTPALTNPDFRFLSVPANSVIYTDSDGNFDYKTVPSTTGTYVFGYVDGVATWLSTASCEDSPSV